MMLTSCWIEIIMEVLGLRQEFGKREIQQQLRNSIYVPRLWCTAFLRSSSNFLSESSSIPTVAGEIAPLSAAYENNRFKYFQLKRTMMKYLGYYAYMRSSCFSKFTWYNAWAKKKLECSVWTCGHGYSEQEKGTSGLMKDTYEENRSSGYAH